MKAAQSHDTPKNIYTKRHNITYKKTKIFSPGGGGGGGGGNSVKIMNRFFLTPLFGD